MNEDQSELLIQVLERISNTLFEMREDKLTERRLSKKRCEFLEKFREGILHNDFFGTLAQEDKTKIIMIEREAKGK